VSSYPAGPRSVSSIAGGGEVPGGGSLMVAVRLADVASPLRNGRPLGEGDRSALAVGGTEKIRSGDQVVFLKVVAVAPARVRRDGRVQAQGSPAGHATLGPVEEWLEEQVGPGVIDGIAERAVLAEQYVKGERERLLARAFMIRVIVLMTLMPDADVREAVIALAGDLAMVPWARAWVPASARACGDWRNALGPEPLEELRDIVLRASWQEHQDRDWRAVVTGRKRPLKAGSLDGTVIRVPDTPANRAAFGSAGTGDDSAPFPQLRALPLNDVSTRALLGMPHGPAGTGKAAGEQKLLDQAMEQYPHLFTKDRLWLMDRNFPGAARIARLIARTHVLIRLKSDIPLKRVSEILPDHSYLAELSGDGVTVTVRVIEYDVTVEGREVPEMFCLVTDLLDWREYPAPELAALYKWRWDGSETALREARACLHGAGPGTGPMLRSGQPGPRPPGACRLGRRHRDDPRRHPRRRPRRCPRKERAPRRAARPAPRDLPCPRPPRHPRRDPRRQNQLRDADQGNRQVPRHHRPEPAPGPQVQVPQHLRPRHTEGHRHPHRRSRHHHGQQPGLTSTNSSRQPHHPPAGPWTRPSPGTTRRPSACPQQATTHRYQNPGNRH
jgi:Insertion element 4 transposase N-terminal